MTTDDVTYRVVATWEQMPAGHSRKDVCGVTVDAEDRVYVLARNEHRLSVYTRDGIFIRSWGEGTFGRPHGLAIGPDGSIYTVDDGDHTVRKFSPEGKLLLILGTPGVPSATGFDESFWGRDLYQALKSIQGGPPFNKPTDVAVAPNGDLYVTDGYANAKVHHFAADGRLIRSWGGPGTGPGQFNLPHGIWIVPDSRVLVADRENDRVQVFSASGAFLAQWTDVQRPTGLCMDKTGRVFVSELPWHPGDTSFVHGVAEARKPGRVSIFDLEGRLLHRWAGGDPAQPGSLVAPHAVAVDSRGDLYVGEVVTSFGKARGLAVENPRTLQKFARA